MRKKKSPKMSWEEAPDIITPENLADILGIGIEGARNIFEKDDFPKISKKEIGNIGKADKDVTRLYLQGIKVKENSRNVAEYMILLELKKLNRQIKENNKSETLRFIDGGIKNEIKN